MRTNKWFGMLQQVEANHNSRTHCDSNQLCTTRPLAMQLQAIAEQLQAFAKYELRTRPQYRILCEGFQRKTPFQMLKPISTTSRTVRRHDT